MRVKHQPLVLALELVASVAAVAVATYVIGSLFVSLFAHPIGAHP